MKIALFCKSATAIRKRGILINTIIALLAKGNKSKLDVKLVFHVINLR